MAESIQAAVPVAAAGPRRTAAPAVAESRWRRDQAAVPVAESMQAAAVPVAAAVPLAWRMRKRMCPGRHAKPGHIAPHPGNRRTNRWRTCRGPDRITNALQPTKMFSMTSQHYDRNHPEGNAGSSHDHPEHLGRS